MASSRLRAPLWLAGLYLVGLRLFAQARDASVPPLRFAFVGDRAMGLLHSLSAELIALALLGLLARAGRPALWLARALLAALLVVEVLDTQVQQILGAYLRGSDVALFHGPDVTMTLSGAMTPLRALALLGALLVGLLHRPPLRWPRPALLAGALALVALSGVALAQQLHFPGALPDALSSPLVLLADVGEAPEGIALATAAAKAEPLDWAPADALAPRWAHLQPPPLDVVLLVLESVGEDALPPARDAPPMPRLQALLPRSARFTRAYAHEPRSIKELEALLFGVFPLPNREQLGRARGGLALESLPERWRALGLHTAFVHARAFPAGEGDTLVRPRFDEVAELAPGEVDAKLGERLGAAIDAAQGKRVGALLWTMQTHAPYALADGSRPRAATLSREGYLESVAGADRTVGAVVDALAARGRLERTALVIIGDHGQSFGAHPEGGRAHGTWLYEESVHVPLIVHCPALFHGELDDTVVQLKDVAATLGWLAGDSRPALNEGSAIFFARKSEPAAYLINFFGGGARGGLVRGRYKLQIDLGLAGVRAERLFDLIADPGERTDLWPAGGEGPALERRWLGWLELERRIWRERVAPRAQR